ncbi:glycosyltransferase family 2 protein [Thioclava sp. FR2]|uniref:glycosyltransferase family 2 protein n=1 Tax=Thioclava sp. FR2 TaxID=3445780 RepID=UPI003EC128A1
MPTSRPVVSVILLCRNEATFIRRSVRSILAQTIGSAVEIVLLDDSSSDGSAAIAKLEVDQAMRPNFTLRVIRSETNLGNAKAFVTALEQARGFYYHVLDADDFWIDPDKLRHQVGVLEAHPSLAGVGHRTILRASEDGSESFHPQQDPLKPVLHLEDLLTGGTYFHTSAMLFRNAFYQAESGQVNIPAIFHEVRGDTIRLLVHAAQGGILYLPRTMSVYDDHKGGIWTGLDWPGRRELLNNLYTRLSEHGYLTSLGEPKAAEYLAARLSEIAAYSPASLRPISLYPDHVMTAPRHRLTEISRISSVLDLETQLSTLTASNSYEEALRLVFRFLSAISYDRNISRAARSRRVTSPEIDWHCANIGGLIAASQNILPTATEPADSAEGPVVILVSGLVEDLDGMWEAAREMIELWQGQKRVVVMSTELLATMPDIQERVGPEVELLLNTDHTLVEKTAWLIWHLSKLKASQIVVVPARNDVVIGAGLRREHAPKIHLVSTYNTGYMPICHSYALTGYLARRPYDLAWFAKIAPNRDLINAPRLISGAPAMQPLPQGTPLVTATAAAADGRFEGHYDFDLHLMIPVLLKSGAHRHIHAGPLSDAILNRIRKELIRQKMPVDAFVYLPTVKNFGAELKAAGASLFLHGFPWPEVTPLLSAMSEGLPVLAHENYLNPALSLADLCPPETPVWANADQLSAVIKSINAEWLSSQSASVSAHVAARNSPNALRETMGTSYMAPMAAEAIPNVHVPEGRQELRRLMSEIMEVTLFRT